MGSKPNILLFSSGDPALLQLCLSQFPPSFREEVTVTCLIMTRFEEEIVSFSEKFLSSMGISFYTYIIHPEELPSFTDPINKVLSKFSQNEVITFLHDDCIILDWQKFLTPIFSVKSRQYEAAGSRYEACSATLKEAALKKWPFLYTKETDGSRGVNLWGNLFTFRKEVFRGSPLYWDGRQWEARTFIPGLGRSLSKKSGGDAPIEVSLQLLDKNPNFLCLPQYHLHPTDIVDRAGLPWSCQTMETLSWVHLGSMSMFCSWYPDCLISNKLLKRVERLIGTTSIVKRDISRRISWFNFMIEKFPLPNSYLATYNLFLSALLSIPEINTEEISLQSKVPRRLLSGGPND